MQVQGHEGILDTGVKLCHRSWREGGSEFTKQKWKACYKWQARELHMEGGLLP